MDAPGKRGHSISGRGRADTHAGHSLLLGEHTLRLAELVKDHDVMGVVEVFSQHVDVLTGQPVGHEDRRRVSVCPVDTILKHREHPCFNMSHTQNRLVRVVVGLIPRALLLL